MLNEIDNKSLTANEISNIWSAYMKSSMETRILEYFFETTDDRDIKKVVEKMIFYRRRNISYLEDIFESDNLKTSMAFTKDDVNINADKVFSDIFILYFCYDIVLFSMYVFSSAYADCAREDIREYFQNILEHNMKNQQLSTRFHC